MKFTSADIDHDAVVARWTGIDPEASATLLLALLVYGPNDQLVQLGTKWVDGEPAAVFAFDFSATHQQNAPQPSDLISISDGTVTIRYPVAWLRPPGNHDQYRATAILNIDGTDKQEWVTPLTRG